MVEFNKTNYFHPMDKPMMEAVPDLKISDMASSAGFGDVLQSVKTELAKGVSHVELVFTGRGKGSLGQGNTTPEMFDKVKRDEIRQLSKINEATVSTHTSIAISGVAGFQQNRFSDDAKQDTLTEIKRTIEFAADAAGGGAVVVHTNEFPRGVTQYKEFERGGEKQETLSLANKETGQIIQIPKHQKLLVPKWQKNKKGDYIDEDGNSLSPDNYSQRQLDLSQNNQIQFEEVDFDGMIQEIAAYNDRHGTNYNPEQEFFFQQQYAGVQSQEPNMLEYQQNYQTLTKLSKEAKREALQLAEIEKHQDPSKNAQLLEAMKEKYPQLKRIDTRGKKASEALKNLSTDIKSQSKRFRQGWLGINQQIERLKRDKDKIQKIETVGLERSGDTFAKAAMYAYDLEKQKGLKKDIYLCPENMMSEWGYGSHPQELKKIVLKSREKMVEMLAERGIKGKKAQKIAANHIKATFDIGHGNTWSRFFKGEKGKSPEQNKKQFNKWLLTQVKDLLSGPDPILGHVHMSDNFGYFDEHLNAGGGNAPLSEFLKLLKEKEYEGKIVVERGAQGQDEPAGATLSAWARAAGSPIYRVEGGASPRWSDIEQSGYFGVRSSPAMIMGGYGTSLGNDWKLWSYSGAPID